MVDRSTTENVDDLLAAREPDGSLDIARGADERQSKIDELMIMLRRWMRWTQSCTHIGSHGRLAATDQALANMSVELDLDRVAPRLLESFGEPCIADEETEEGREREKQVTADSDFELEIRRRIQRLESAMERHDPDDRAPYETLTRLLTRLVDSGCRTASVPAFPALIAICDTASQVRGECLKFRRPAGLSVAFSDDRLVGVPAHAEEHMQRHVEFARSWRYLAAHLAARLDDIGRRSEAARVDAFNALGVVNN